MKKATTEEPPRTLEVEPPFSCFGSTVEGESVLMLVHDLGDDDRAKRERALFLLINAGPAIGWEAIARTSR